MSMTSKNKHWHVYLLCNEVNGKTYIGCTTDPLRRLKQHNREIVGGAKSTEAMAGRWYIYFLLTGFGDRANAMRWEKILKSRARGLKQRALAFYNLSLGICPEGKFYEPPKDLIVSYHPSFKRNGDYEKEKSSTCS